jgi:hypothetical protein
VTVPEISWKYPYFSGQQTTTDLYQNIFKNYSKILENELKTSIQQKDYVLKFRGMEEYLVDPSLKLIYYPTIRNLLRKNQKIEVVLLEKKSLPIKSWEKLTDYYQEVLPNKNHPDLFLVQTNYPFDPNPIRRIVLYKFPTNNMYFNMG